MSFLGSAAGSAGALGEAGGHNSGKEKRRAASARRVPSTPPKAGKDRSRSPGDDVPIVKTEVADRSIVAPLYIAPGGEGDPMGADGRRAHNMEKIYGFMNVVAQVLDQHAECIDLAQYEQKLTGRADRDRATEIKAAKAGILKVEEDFQSMAGIVQANDERLKEGFAASTAKI